jgi:F-type H+-transporting ATPase subunit delta
MPGETQFEGLVVAGQQIVGGVAGRYANALFDLAVEQNSVPATATSLSNLQGMIAESDELQRLLNSPVFKSEDQMAALDALAAKGGVSGLAVNFAKLMCENRRLAVLPEAIAGFQALVAEAKGEMVAEVTSAEKLTAAQLKDLSAALKARVGKDVSLSTKVDSSILGGLIVKIGSTMIDNSLKTKLQNLKVSMKGTG